MKYFIVVIFICLGIGVGCMEVQAQPQRTSADGLSSIYEEGIVLWRGFSHKWTYNHRLNRLGSYVVNPQQKTSPYKATLHHASATGIGADVGVYDGHYTFVAANGVRMFSGVEDINFSGKEGDLHNKKVEVEMVLPGSVFKEGNFEVVLNGFDVVSKQKADKLHMFHLSVEDIDFIPYANKVRFTINVGMVVRCQSLECNRFNNKFDYKVQVYYAVLNGTNKMFATTENSFHELYTWNKDKEILISPVQKKIVSNNGKFPDAVIAFKSLTVNLDQPHWFLEWRSVVRPQNAQNPTFAYDETNGSMKYEVDVLFKQWRSDMKKESAFPRHSRYSSKKPGWAGFSGTVVLLQFADAYVMNGREMGIIKWEGSNSMADGDDALFKHDLVFGDDILSMKETELKQKEEEKNKKINEKYSVFVGDLDRMKEQKRVDKKEVKDQKKWERQFDKMDK